jgi:sugar phosphate isomerase/epimerase
MAHPRISVSALSSVRWSFEEDLACWRELGVGWAGLMGAKLGDDLDARFTALADLRATLLRAAPHIALVQLTDVSVGTVRSPDDPPSGGRVPFGEGDLPLARILGDIKDTGYAGPLELELIGPLGDSAGYAPVTRRGVAAAEVMLGQAGL